METDKTKTEDKEPYQNIYEQYYHFNIEWHNWQRYIGGVITANGANCEYINSQLSELEKYMLESILGGKWYEHNCPDLMKNEPNTTGFLFWWRKRYEGKLQPVDDTASKVDECNTFFFNYSKWKYLKSLLKEPQQEIPKGLQTDEAKTIFGKAIKAGLMVSTETGCYQWKKSTALLAYMCDVMSENLNLKASNGNIRWALFKPLFGIDKNNNSLRDAVNEYKNKTGQTPDGYKIIDSLF